MVDEYHGTQIEFHPVEARVFAALKKKVGLVVDADSLCGCIRRDAVKGELQVIVNRIRNKIGKRNLITVRSEGYKLLE